MTEKQHEVARLKITKPLDRDRRRHSLRDFKAAISIPQKISLIAEVKFASPSAGLIHKKTDPVLIGRIFQEAGASAISLLTDKRFFQGDIEQLPHLKKTISLPILRKDFIIDVVQVEEAFFYGADAILLIARILSQQHLSELTSFCQELGMAPLIEIHSEDDLEKAVACGAEIIGINNRDLDSFKVDINTTFELAPLVPENFIVVSESGIRDEADILSLKEIGIHAILVGSAIMKSNDLGAKTADLVNAGGRQDG
jgi:indole-3-glycerol phosphate synthase